MIEISKWTSVTAQLPKNVMQSKNINMSNKNLMYRKKEKMEGLVLNVL